MLTSATVAPTERSRPAVMIANVCPNDTQASAAAATPMLRKFGTEKNTSEISENSRIIKARSEEHTSELQSHLNLVCRLLLEKKKTKQTYINLVRTQLI